MKVVSPDLGWYTKISTDKGLSPRCPFASVHLCPRFYQSLSLLGHAGSTKIDPVEDEILLKKWRESDLWPTTDEQATSTAGPNNDTKHFWNFCPEVSYERFGLFALNIDRYADEIDIELAHSKLSKEGASRGDWRWVWASVKPLHYSECPLYSPLLFKTSLPKPDPKIIEVFTIEEAASFLKSDSGTVEALLKSGALVGFKISNEWRIRPEELSHFMSRQIESQQLESFKQAISDPKVWARELTKNPELEKQIKQTEYSDGTVGAFLKAGLSELEMQENLSEVTDIRDVFICHASEDKREIIEPLLKALDRAKISYWYDRAEIKWGDSLTEKVNEGLSISRYVIVSLSKPFLEKPWPRRELNAALNIEAKSAEVKILPLLCGTVTERQMILEKLPLLNDKYYLIWDGNPANIVHALESRLGIK